MGFSRQEYWSGLPSPPEGLNLGLPPCRQVLYCLSRQGSWLHKSKQITTKKIYLRNSLAVQWLGLHAFTAEGLGVRSLVGELKSYKLDGDAKNKYLLTLYVTCCWHEILTIS